jgi:hypothetical protein
LAESFPYTARVTIADSGSSDGTWPIAAGLARQFPEVRAVRMELPGRGRALRTVWSGSDAEVLAYRQRELRRRHRLLGHRAVGDGALHQANRRRPDRL